MQKTNIAIALGVCAGVVASALPQIVYALVHGGNISVAVLLVVMLLVIGVAVGIGYRAVVHKSTHSYGDQVVDTIADLAPEDMMVGMPVIERADGTVGDVGESWWTDAVGEEAVASETQISCDLGHMALMLDFHPGAFHADRQYATPVQTVCIIDDAEVEAAFAYGVAHPVDCVRRPLAPEPDAVPAAAAAAAAPAAVRPKPAEPGHAPVERPASQEQGLVPVRRALQPVGMPALSRRIAAAGAQARRLAVPVAAGVGVAALAAVGAMRRHRAAS